MHRRCPLDEKKIFCLCLKDTATLTPEKLYTTKYIVMMEAYIADSHTSFYIPAIKKLVFHLPHVRILGNNDCGSTGRKAFKLQSANQDVLCCLDYTDRVVASLAHQIQCEYYGEN